MSNDRPRQFDDRPLLVFWETTKACLLACYHCRADAQRSPGPGELSTAEGRALIDELAALERPRPVLILTGGDCLMRPDIVDLAAHAQARSVPVAIAPSVTARLTPEILARLRAVGVKTASLSLDGASAGTHESIRGVEGHFSDTMEAIRLLKAHGFTVQINTTVMQNNVHELPGVVKLLRDERVDIWEVFFLINTGRGIGVGALDAAENEDVCHFLVDAARYGFTVRTVEAPFFRRVATERKRASATVTYRTFDVGGLYLRLKSQLDALLGQPEKPVKAPTVATRDGKGIVFVAADGAVYPSGFLPITLGNVRDRGLIAIYREHPLLREIRDTRFAGLCGTCEYADLCGGSRARAHAATGDPLGEDPACVRTLVGASV
jgi:radical SAM protein